MTKRERIFTESKGKCHYCGQPLAMDTFHMDHVHPKALGGKDKDNLVGACSDCNLAKGNLDLEDFREKLGMAMRIGAKKHIALRCLLRLGGMDPEEDYQVSFFFERGES